MTLDKPQNLFFSFKYGIITAPINSGEQVRRTIAKIFLKSIELTNAFVFIAQDLPQLLIPDVGSLSFKEEHLPASHIFLGVIADTQIWANTGNRKQELF